MAKKAEKSVRIKQTRSLIGRNKKQRATVAALGLRRIGHAVEHVDTPQIRGMIKKVEHLIAVEEA
jgi:large subunit ribosomal protein L30